MGRLYKIILFPVKSIMTFLEVVVLPQKSERMNEVASTGRINGNVILEVR
jgi:hypothetical protein